MANFHLAKEYLAGLGGFSLSEEDALLNESFFLGPFKNSNFSNRSLIKLVNFVLFHVLQVRNRNNYGCHRCDHVARCKVSY